MDILALRPAQASRYCGRYTCHAEEINEMLNGDYWLEGSIISVLAEKMFIMNGGFQSASAWHLSSLVLKTAQELLERSNDKQAIVDGRQRLINYFSKVTVTLMCILRLSWVDFQR
jgi:hypothetical protein